MTGEPVVIESDIVTRVAKKVRVLFPEGRPCSLRFLADRLVTEVSVLWAHEDGAWVAQFVDVTSSVALRDGRPSAMSKTHVLTPGERHAFLAEFPDAAEPPAERVTITITEGTAE